METVMWRMSVDTTFGAICVSTKHTDYAIISQATQNLDWTPLEQSC